VFIVGWFDPCHVRQSGNDTGADGHGDRDARNCTGPGDCDGTGSCASPSADDRGASSSKWSCVVPLAVGQHQLQPVHPGK
jgi:hypothetical protein